MRDTSRLLCASFVAAGITLMLTGCGATRVIEPALCQSNSECPEGYSCNAGTCEAGGTPADGTDAGTPDDGGTVLHPTTSGLCKPCQADAECGVGAFCLADDQAGGSFCGTACTSSTQCGSDSACYSIGDGSGNTLGRNCFPAAGTCSGWGGTTTTTTPDAGTGATCTDTWTSYGKGFFSGYCTRCHSWGSTYSRVQGKSSSIRADISSGSMPRGARLSATEKARILAWIACGMP